MNTQMMYILDLVVEYVNILDIHGFPETIQYNLIIHWTKTNKLYNMKF